MHAPAASKAQPGEIQFGFDELFFSRTDAGGIIQFGNSVFQRVAVYSWDELLKKPHKIIRHPDMPRAVFWLLWDTIKAGKPIGAYVKNRTKDGRYYWVYALVTPVEGGYLSVRLRPSSPLLEVVKKEYDALTALERAERLSPADSAAHLLGRLQALGFQDYPTFMASTLGAELNARDTHLGRAVDPLLTQFAHLLGAAQSLLAQAAIIANAYIANETVPFNFRVLAAQLGKDGSAIGVISTNYAELSNEMQAILNHFISSANSVYSAIADGFFLAGTAKLQTELLNFFEQEAEVPGLPREVEMRMLDLQQQEYRSRAAAGLIEIAHTIDGFQQASLGMNRLTAGLEVTRIMGKVECSRHTLVKDRLDELLSDLSAFQSTVSNALKEIQRMNHGLRQDAFRLLASANKAA